MSVAKENLESESPKAGDGLMTRFLKKMFLRDGQIAAVDRLTEHFRLISLKGEGLKNVDWKPGDKVQISLGEGFAMRTYTPIAWDAETGQTQLLVYAHGDAPGSRWAREARNNEAVRFFGPRGSLDLSAVSSAILFGDETCFGLGAALRNTAGGKSALCVFEATDPEESTIALAAIGVSDAVLIERKPDESHLSAVHAELLRMARSDAQFVLAGKAASIQSVRKALATAGISSTRMKAKAYWTPGKVGPD